MKSELICLQTVILNLAVLMYLYYFMLQLGLGEYWVMAPPLKSLYIVRSNCTKFGAFVRFLPILLLTDLTMTLNEHLWHCGHSTQVLLLFVTLHTK